MLDDVFVFASERNKPTEKSIQICMLCALLTHTENTKFDAIWFSFQFSLDTPCCAYGENTTNDTYECTLYYLVEESVDCEFYRHISSCVQAYPKKKTKFQTKLKINKINSMIH